MDSAIKYKIVEKIIHSNDDDLLNEIERLLGLSEKDFWFELPDEVKQGINKAKAQLENGEGIPHEAVMNEINLRFFNK